MAGLVGRAAEMRQVARLLAAASPGDLAPRGGAVLISGGAGMGKTALLRAAAGQARQAGFTVLPTEGVAAEALLPFAALHRLLRPLLGGARALPAALRAALLTAFGEADGEQPEPFRVALAALTLLADAAARRPVLVAADDVHLLDGPSHEALAFMSRRVGGLPAVILATVSGERAGPVSAIGLPVMRLHPLDAVAARELLAAHAAGISAPGQDQMLAAAAGCPLALVDLPVAWRAAAGGGEPYVPHALPLTARLARALAGQVAGLSGTCRDALLVAALYSGDEMPAILAAARVLAGRTVTVAALDEAHAATLVGLDAGSVRFRHPLTRSAITAAETPSRIRAAHAALAEVLGDQPRWRAWHRAQSVDGTDDAVADELERIYLPAARRAPAITSAWALERAAQLTADPARRARRLLLAAERGFGLGRPDLVDRLLDAAARYPLTTLDQARMLWLREAFIDGVPGDAARVAQLCEASGQAAEAGDPELALNLLLAAALRCWWADPGPAARARAARNGRARGW